MNKLFDIFIFTLCALLSSSGLMVLKMAIQVKPFNFTNIFEIILTFRFISGFILYILGFIMWMFILSKYKVGIAYPIITTLLLVMVTIGSCLILDEPFSIKQLIGIIICLSGIIVLSV